MMRSSPLLPLLRADWAANKANPKGLVVTTAFRIAHHVRGTGRPPVWSLPIIVLYRLLVDWILGIEIPPSVQAGPGLCIWHGTGLVLHKDVQLGCNVTLRHGVTIGTLGEEELSAAPVLGDSVSVGAGAIILGPYQIGDAAIIGAGAVVVTDVPAGATVVGNPGRILPNKDASGQ
jgi:serine acetyltransferase